MTSQYRRVLAANPGLSGHAFNDARTGAKMSDLSGQLQTAGQGVDYATVLMGANDVCTSTIATMTPTATFSAQFESAPTAFFAQRRDAHVFVSSIPNVYQLWSLLHTRATSTWRTFGICQSMLASSNTDAQRHQVLVREKADNAALQTVCTTFTGCRFDGGAVFNYGFVASEVSTVDYFHPSVSGQNTLARLTWAAAYWCVSA